MQPHFFCNVSSHHDIVILKILKRIIRKLYIYTCPYSEQQFLLNSCDGVCFQARLAVFTLHENTMGCFSKASKSKCNQQSERISPVPIFFFSNPGLTYFLLHFATQMSFILLSLFLFKKMWKLIFLLSPSHFRAWLSQILSRARDMGSVCGYKYKINYQPNRHPITGDHL